MAKLASSPRSDLLIYLDRGREPAPSSAQVDSLPSPRLAQVFGMRYIFEVVWHGCQARELGLAKSSIEFLIRGRTRFGLDPGLASSPRSDLVI